MNLKMEKLHKPRNKLAQFFEKRPVMAVSGIISLGLAYVFASWAIDTGSLLDYALVLLSLFFGVRELTAAIFNKQA